MKAQALRIAGYVLAGLLALWLLDRAGRDEGDARARTEMHERNAAIALRDLRAERKKVDTVIVAVTKQGRRVDTAVDATRDALDSARAVLADGDKISKDSTIARLRASLGTLTVRAEELVAEAVIYRATVDELTLAVAMERAANGRVITAKDAVIASLKAERCTLNLLVAKISCPTRTQVGVGSVLTTLLVVAAIK